MKNNLILFVALLLSSVAFAATDASLFYADNASITEEFATLDQLDKELTLLKAEGSSYKMTSTSLLTLQQMNTCSSSMSLGDMLDTMDWGAFSWGFCCCPIGFFIIVADDSQDSNSKKSYWIGVIVGLAVSALSSSSYYFVY